MVTLLMLNYLMLPIGYITSHIKYVMKFSHDLSYVTVRLHFTVFIGS